MTQRNVLITGAGSGIGRALAERYAAAGCAVACADINSERAQETVNSLPGSGHSAHQVDVGSDASFDAFATAINARTPTLDVLINNAGIASGGSMLEAEMSEWRELLEIDLLSVVRGCRAFLPGMLKSGRGQIISTASFAGLAGAPGIMTYGVAKAGVVALSEQLRAEVAARGVRVSVACPSFLQTKLLESFRGSEKMRGAAGRLMQHSADTLDSVADRYFAAAERGDFLILPTRTETLRWRIKRWFPEYYFRKLQAATSERRQALK
ncbi:MAG: SDR family NAD(P)-dependent oxidoreductase [Lysobacterales bacterium]